ncbi:MAG: ImmA/IrrE family metallo-endopeptidase [Ruminococcus sp.]
MIGMDLQEISRCVKQIVTKYGLTDPRKLCAAMDIAVVYKDMGTDKTSIKAMLVVDRRIGCIVVNSNLPDVILRFILAHELGHAMLHARNCKQFTDRSVFDDASRMEKEANVFAAELLLGDSKELMEEMTHSEHSMFQLAAAHHVPYELLAYKLEVMDEEGFDVPELPYEPDNCFLQGMLGMDGDFSYWGD